MGQSDVERAALEWLDWVEVFSIPHVSQHAKTVKTMLARTASAPVEKPRRWTVSASGRLSKPYSDAVTVTSLDEVHAAVRRFSVEGFPVTMIFEETAW